jgi:hypothetical protein
LEDLYATLGQGPAVDTAAGGEPVTAADLDHPQAHTRWPRFAGQATASGIRAVFAYPVLLEARPIAVLSLYRATAGTLSTAERDQADLYAWAATVLLLDSSHTSSGRLSITLPVHVREVQQAIGVVMEYAGVDAGTALHRIRVYARRSARPMRAVVAEVRTCRLPFDPTTPV